MPRLPITFDAPHQPVLVRRAELSDVEDYVHLHTALLSTTYAHLFPPDFARMRRSEFDQRCHSLTREIEAAEKTDINGHVPIRRPLVAETASGSLVAVASSGDGIEPWEADVIGKAWTPPATTWCLDHLYLAPGLHGSGLAGVMLEALLPHGHGYLWAIRDNTRALSFYRKHGFRPDGLSALSGPAWCNQPMDRWVRT